MWNPANKAAFPSQEETRYAKEAISKLELVLKDAYELLEQAKTRVSKLVAELEERKAWIAPIRRLPVEILSEIFIFSSEIGDLVPVTITEVSRLWREVILATPRAWSCIHVNAPRHESHMVPYVSIFIEQSDPCLLHICLPDLYINDEDSTEFVYEDVTLLLLPYLSRIECLSTPSSQLATLSEEGMPNLTQLEIRDDSWYIDPFFISDARFPCLRSINSTACTWAESHSFAWFPPLQHLSIYMDTHSTWLDAIRICANSLNSLRVTNRYELQETSTVVTIAFPKLESLTTNEWSWGPTGLLWPLQLVTPALISYEENSEENPILRTFHSDVNSVRYLRSNRVLDLSAYVNLRIYSLKSPFAFLPEASGSQLAEQLGQDSNTCPALQMIQFDIMGLVGEEAKIESIKNGIMEAIRNARPSVEVVFTNRFAPMPGSMDENSCGPAMPCAQR